MSLQAFDLHHYPRLRTLFEPLGYNTVVDSVIDGNTPAWVADDMAGWVRSFWASDADFAARGLGFCLANDAAIGSWCVSVFVSGGDYEIGVATAPPYQGRCFATPTATAFVKHCTQNRLTPHWPR